MKKKHLEELTHFLHNQQMKINIAKENKRIHPFNIIRISDLAFRGENTLILVIHKTPNQIHLQFELLYVRKLDPIYFQL